VKRQTLSPASSVSEAELERLRQAKAEIVEFVMGEVVEL